MAKQDQMISWLNDAYAMEQSVEQVLQNHVKDAKNHPQLQAKLQEHLQQTKHHADLVKGCIQRLNGSTSSLKSGLAQVMGTIQGVATGMFQDELVKNGIQDYATENFEIATYTALIAAARDLGDTDTARVCEEIRQDEEGMARWLLEHLPTIVTETMQRQQGAPASEANVQPGMQAQ